MNMRNLMTLVEGDRLDELQGIKQHQAQNLPTRNAVIAYMEKQGYDLLGVGEYGAVFDHEKFGGRYVLKLFSDPNYEYFVNFCKTQKNPSYPKFFGNIMKVSQNARMVRVERLYHLNGAQMDDVLTIDKLVNDVMQDKRDEQEARESLVPVYAALFDAIYQLAMIAPQGASMDIHGGNVMLRRGSTTLVVSDPYDGGEFKM